MDELTYNNNMSQYQKPLWRDAISKNDLFMVKAEEAFSGRCFEKDISDEERIKNAIKWIDALDPKEGYRKTIGKLGRLNSGETDEAWSEVQDHKAEGSYCCLGIACITLGLWKEKVTGYNIFQHGYEQRLENLMGVNPSCMFLDRDKKTVQVFYKLFEAITCLMRVNDSTYMLDKDFSNMREFILDNLSLIFKPEVALGLKTHYTR